MWQTYAMNEGNSLSWDPRLQVRPEGFVSGPQLGRVVLSKPGWLDPIDADTPWRGGLTNPRGPILCYAKAIGIMSIDKRAK
jgi:hypothetical protein